MVLVLSLVGLFLLGVLLSWLEMRNEPREEDDTIQLRDAHTGRCLGMTKRQLRRFEHVLGTKNEVLIAREVAAIRARKEALNGGPDPVPEAKPIVHRSRPRRQHRERLAPFRRHDTQPEMIDWLDDQRPTQVEEK